MCETCTAVPASLSNFPKGTHEQTDWEHLCKYHKFSDKNWFLPTGQGLRSVVQIEAVSQFKLGLGWKPRDLNTGLAYYCICLL